MKNIIKNYIKLLNYELFIVAIKYNTFMLCVSKQQIFEKKNLCLCRPGLLSTFLLI